jgi:hypothetical protein
MTAGVIIENCRQLAFVSSLLAGFAFTFYGVLLTTSTAHRVASWACFLAVAASIIFLLVTLGNTFAAVVASSLPKDNPMPPSIAAQKFPAGYVFSFWDCSSVCVLRPRRMDTLSPVGCRYDNCRWRGIGVCLRSPYSLYSLATQSMEPKSLSQSSNQSMKPTAPLRCKTSVFATTPCRGLSLSR